MFGACVTKREYQLAKFVSNLYNMQKKISRLKIAWEFFSKLFWILLIEIKALFLFLRFNFDKMLIFCIALWLLSILN